jgi:flagellar basal body rod protein FlgG
VKYYWIAIGLLGVVAGCAAKPAGADTNFTPSAETRAMRLLALGAVSIQSPADAIAAADEVSKPLARAVNAIDDARKIVAENLANAQTIAYKRLDVVFPDAGKPQIRLDMEQGPVETTSRALDVCIEGTGFFRVITPEGIGDGFAYTRNGNFFINNNSELVLGMGDGYRLDPPITVPSGIAEDRITISQDGTVSVIPDGQLKPQVMGQLQLARFTNPSGLKNLGGSLFAETASSGKPLIGKPLAGGAGKVLQGYLEGSNVDAIGEELRLHKLNAWREQLVLVARQGQK